MVVKRQWKLVSGGVVAAVTLSGGAALAQSGGEAQELPQLQDVVDVTEVKLPSLAGSDLLAEPNDSLLQVTGDESPFSALSASQESASEPSMSEPSISEPSESVSEQSASEPSIESVSEQSASEPSIESVSEQSVSEPSIESVSEQSVSEPSIESESVPSAESDD